MACQHHLWEAQKVKHHKAWHASIAFGQHTDDRHRAWHDITSFGQRTRSNDVDRDMTSPPLESTHGRITSGVACHHHLWAAQQVERRRAWHAILPLGSTHGRTMSGVACHYCLWVAQTVERRQAWHAIAAFGQHTRSNDVGRGMPSSQLGSTHGRTTSAVACHHRP